MKISYYEMNHFPISLCIYSYVFSFSSCDGMSCPVMAVCAVRGRMSETVIGSVSSMWSESANPFVFNFWYRPCYKNDRFDYMFANGFLGNMFTLQRNKSKKTKHIMKIKSIVTLVAVMLAMSTSMIAQSTLPPLHVDGNNLKDQHGNTVVLHGVMDTPSPYFNDGRWGNSCSNANISSCVNYFNKLFTAITDNSQGAYCNIFRLHLDPCWTNDPNKTSDGKESGEADISRFSETRLRTYMRTLYWRIIQQGLKHGLYVVVRPPGVCPGKLQVGDYYQDYLMTVWDIVTQNDSILKYSGQVSIELANEPVSLVDADGKDTPSALHDYFQPIVDKIRANGFTGVIWVPGTGYQSNYSSYASRPIEGYNIGYAVHNYPGWYGGSDDNYNSAQYIKNFEKQVPVVKTNPILISEVDWSPEKEGEGKYNEFGEWVPANYGTWATASTSKWGSAYKALLDHFGNISMTLTGTADYIDIDKYLADGTVTPAFDANPECCAKACFDWYADYAKVNYAHKAYTRQWTADLGNNTFVNPIVNADFPDPDVIRVDDTYYMVTTTMHHFPGATILKSKDLVNWEYCSNPLLQIADNPAYNLTTSNHYSQGQWAASLNYSKGKFYLYFIAYGKSGVDETINIMLTTEDPEGTWEMTKMTDHYYDSGWLFDDGENGDGFVYVACGIGDIYMNKLDRNFKRIESTRVLSLGNGLEGSHLYHIGDYYYIYATYGGTEGSQTIFRSKNPLGPYEEHVGRVFANQHIHQGALVETQMGEWWTVLFKDAGAIGRIPYLEPVKWVDGWPVIGNNGIDVTKGGKAHAKPNVGRSYERTYLPTNDTFTEPQLGMQWQWNHNPDNSAWSLMESPGQLRLHTVNVTDSLDRARNSLTQRIFGYNCEGTASANYIDSYGTIKMATAHMQEGDVAGIAVFQDPYSFIGVTVKDGKRMLVSMQSAYTEGADVVAAKQILGDEVTADTIFLRAVVNYGTNKARYYYSYDNETYTSFGIEMNMRYTLKIFVGQRFYLFNYATKQLGGYIDIDWFSTEPEYSEELFYAPGVLKTYTEDDLTMESLSMEKDVINITTGSAAALEIISISKSGLRQNIASSCTYNIENSNIVTITGGRIISKIEGETGITATYTDMFGNSQSVSFTVKVSTFPLTQDAVNPSIYGNGTFTEKTGALKTSLYGFGGWQYTTGLDISDYKYIVIKFRRGASCTPSFRVFDSNNYWSDCYIHEMGTAKEAVIDIHAMTNSKGEPIDPSHIYMAGFWTNGTQAIYISEIYLSNDGVTPVGINGVEMDTVGETDVVKIEYFTLDGRAHSSKQRGTNIVRRTHSDGTTDVFKLYCK